jgi:hypothetical protein
MAIERRPVRPTTRVPGPAPRPATSRVPSVAPQKISAPSKKATGRVGRADRPPTRGVAVAPKNNTPLIIGGVVGGVALLAILAVAMSGGEKKHSEPAAVKRSVNEKPDVSQLEREGLLKCNQGVKLIKDAMGSNDKAGLERGVALISEGNGLLDKANTLGNTGGYDTKEVNQTLILARKKLQELRN